LRKLRIWRF